MSEWAGSNVRKQRKEIFDAKLRVYLGEFKNVLIVQIDNVGSSQMQKVRGALRGKGVVLMGKNTLIRRIIRQEAVAHPQLENLLPYVVGNMGFVFTNGSLADLRKTILDNKVPAAAKSGQLAQSDVYIPPGPTGMDPGQTSFFQALNIATKIVKGAIEIINTVHLIKHGEKVNSSHVALLGKLNILPFHYGFKVTTVYENGTVYDASILDIDQNELLQRFLRGVQKLAAVSLAIGYPTLASLPHIIAGGFQKLVAISLATDFTFKQSQTFKDYLADPSKFVSSAPAGGGGGGAGGKKKEEEKAPVKEKEKSEESEADMGFSLFD